MTMRVNEHGNVAEDEEFNSPPSPPFLLTVNNLWNFWSKVRKTDTCWLWEGAASNGRYGCIGIEGKRYLAHRISYLIHNGELPDDLCICHRCNIKLCVNPDHLFSGTVGDNNRHAFETGIASQIGKYNNNSVLTEEQVKEIKRMTYETLKYIALKFNVHVETIRDIRLGKTWRHVQ